MTPEEIKATIRDAINAMVKNEPESQESANELIRAAIRTKASQLVSPPEAAEPEVDLTTPEGGTTPATVVDPNAAAE